MTKIRANIEVLPRGVRLALLVGAVGLMLFPLVGGYFYVQLVTTMMILAIFAMSLDLLLGVTGMVSLGHGAYFGLGGYALAYVSLQGGAVGVWWSLPLAMVVAGLAALVIGFLVVRTRGIYFIMVTLAFAQMCYYFFFDRKSLGGSDGMYVDFRPDLSVFGNQLVDLEDQQAFYYFTFVVLVLVYLFLRRMLSGTFGRTLAGVRVNEHRMRALGYDTFAYKLSAFAMAGMLAGLAGYLWGAHTGFVNPEMMGFNMSAYAIMMVILGGTGNFVGAIVGAFAFEGLIHGFKSLPTVLGFDAGKHWQLWLGIFIVLVITFAPRGLFGLWLRNRPTKKAGRDE